MDTNLQGLFDSLTNAVELPPAGHLIGYGLVAMAALSAAGAMMGGGNATAAPAGGTLNSSIAILGALALTAMVAAAMDQDTPRRRTATAPAPRPR